MKLPAISDTSAEAERVQFEILRKAGPQRRFQLCRELTAAMVGLSRRALARARPELGEREVLVEWVAVHYGRELAEGFRKLGRR